MDKLSRLAAAFILIGVAGCAGGPDISSRRVPEWVLSPPEGSAQFEVFVVSASGESAAVAEEAAGFTLLNQINQALGVDITVVTTAQARASFDSFETDLVQQVTQTGTGRVDGLRVADRYISEQAGQFVVYLLGEYETAAFRAERSRRESLLRQEEELLSAPESNGDRLASSGRLTQAVAAYAGAAHAASGSRLQQAPIVLGRSLRKALELARRIQLSLVSGPATVEIDGPMEAIVYRLTDDRNNPVAGAGIEISYVERRGSRDRVRTEVMITDSRGIVSFVHPAPGGVGEFSTTARLQIEPVLTLLRSVRGYEPEIDALTNALIAVRATHSFIVLSKARTIPTAVFVQDRDAGNRIVGQGRTSEGVVHALSAAGFTLRVVASDLVDAETAQPDEIIRLVAEATGGESRRVVYGTGAIVETRTDDGVLVKVRGTAAVLDLESGEVIYAVDAVKNARGSTAERALTTAFFELGREMGDELAGNLP